MVTSKYKISYSYKKNWVKMVSNGTPYWVNDTNKYKNIICIICNKNETIHKKSEYDTCSKKCTYQAIELNFIQDWLNGKNKKLWTHKTDNRPSNYIYNYFYKLHYEDLEINKITPCCKVEIPEAWRGSKTFMQLNHINHIHDDARRDNLELICSNCHSAKTQSWLEMKLDGKRGRFSKNTEVLKKLRKEMEVK